MLNNTLRLNFCYLKIIHILHRRYHSKIIGHILKKRKRTNPLYSWNYTINHKLKMKMKIKHRSQRYYINITRKNCPYLELFWSAFSRNTERYGESLHIHSKCRKTRTRINPNTDTFHVVIDLGLYVNKSSKYKYILVWWCLYVLSNT